MAYVKQTWTNDDPSTPLSGPRLTHMEDGIGDAHTLASAAQATADGAIPNTIVDAKGDLLVGSAADTLARLPAATGFNKYLHSDANAPLGVKWADAFLLQKDGVTQTHRHVIDFQGDGVTVEDNATFVKTVITIPGGGGGGGEAVREVTVADLGATYDLDLAGAQQTVLIGTLTQDCTISISNARVGFSEFTLELRQNGVGGHTATLPGGSTVTDIANGVDTVAGYSPDGTILRLFEVADPSSSAPVGARVHATTPQALPGSSSTTALTYDSERRDDGNVYDSATPTRLTAPVAGWYQMGVSLDVDNTTNNRYLRIRVNGSTNDIAIDDRPAGSELRMRVNTMYYLNAGDYIESVVTTGTAVVNTVVTPDRSPEFWMVKVA